MKNILKHKSEIFKQDINMTIDEKLEKLKGKVLAPKKLDEANRLLRKLKSPLPNIKQ